MNRSIRIGLVIVAVLGLAAPLALAQAVPIGKNGEVSLGSTTRVGAMLLEQGHYQFQHLLHDGQHYLVVRERQTLPTSGGTHVVAGRGRELGRVPCRVVSTADDSKARATTLYTTRDPDGVARATQIDIEGERAGHVMTLEPQS